MITWQDYPVVETRRSGIRLIRHDSGWTAVPGAAWHGAGDVRPGEILPTCP